MDKEGKIIDPETPLFKLTVEEYLSILPWSKETKLVTGYQGLQNLLQISRSKAVSLVKSGKIDKAIHKTGKIYVFDVQKVLELIRKRHSDG